MRVLFYIQFFLCFGLFSTCKTKNEVPLNREIKFTIDSISVSQNSKVDSSMAIFDDLVNEKMIVKPDNPQSSDGVKKSHPKQLKIKVVETPKIYRKTNAEGKVVYQIPSEMKVRETYQVFVRIGKSSVNIYENLDGDVRETVIPVTQTMEVNLIDPSPKDNKAFDIIPDNDETQLVDSSDAYTQWSWNVTPLKTGSSSLKIVISIIRDGNKKEVVYQDRVEVKVNPMKQFMFWLKNYWQWLFTVLLIPVFKWVYDKYIKKEKTQ